jgi:hypothetical protein
MSLLWFRRSRRSEPKEVKHEAETPAMTAEPVRQVRAPLHIRGLLLINLKPSDGTAEIESAPPLGRRSDVIGTIHAVVPNMAFTDGRGELKASDHQLTIDLGAHDPVHAAVVAAEGDSGIELLRALLERARWRAYAPRAGVFIEPEALDLFALPDNLSPPQRS